MREWYEIAAALITPFEGLHTLKSDGLVYPYLDKLAKPPVWTQGYGICYGISESSPPITKQQATKDFEVGVRTYGLRCAALSPVLLQHPKKLAAVTSWAWNCGVGAYKVSRLRKAIDREDWVSAGELILKPQTAGGVVYRGLVRRREAEASLFRS